MVLAAPIVKCVVCAFQNVRGGFDDRIVLDGAAFVCDFVAVGLVELAADHLVGVAKRQRGSDCA